jgi:hypothetical protein
MALLRQQDGIAAVVTGKAVPVVHLG